MMKVQSYGAVAFGEDPRSIIDEECDDTLKESTTFRGELIITWSGGKTQARDGPWVPPLEGTMQF